MTNCPRCRSKKIIKERSMDGRTKCQDCSLVLNHSIWDKFSEYRKKQDRAIDLEIFTKELVKIVELSNECLASDLEEECRYDHNRNCQTHGWFGLDGKDCPISEYKLSQKVQEHPMWKELEGE